MRTSYPIELHCDTVVRLPPRRYSRTIRVVSGDPEPLVWATVDGERVDTFVGQGGVLMLPKGKGCLISARSTMPVRLKVATATSKHDGRVAFRLFRFLHSKWAAICGIQPISRCCDASH